MDREHIEDSAEKAKGTFEDTAGKVTDDKKLLDEVGSRTTSRQLVFGVTSWRSFLLPGYWRFVTSGKAALPARNEQRGGTFRQKSPTLFARSRRPAATGFQTRL